MVERAHTPGPWRSSLDEFGDFLIQPAAQELVVAAVVNGAARGLSGEADEHAANARLIAAAPDLLESLRYLVAHCKGLDRFEGNPINEAIRAAREAIAKAEGRA